MAVLTRAEKIRRLLIAVGMTVVLLFALYGIRDGLVAATVPSVTFSAGGYRLVRITAGQLWTTSFARPPSPSEYNFNGSATVGTRFITWRSGMLGVGVDDRNHKTFRGYFTETKTAFPAGSYVQTLMTPYPAAQKPRQVAETILAVQTANTDVTGLLNYVIVSYTEAGSAHLLQIGYAQGLIRGAKTYITKNLAQPGLMARMDRLPVTVTTNGHNFYAVWLGNTLLYRGTRLHLGIAPPFQVYLEVQARDAEYVADFHNLNVYSSNRVTVQGLPAQTRLTWTSGHLILSAKADAHGIAILTLPPVNLTTRGRLTLQIGGRRVLFSHITLHGGDRFRFSRPWPL